VAVRKGCECDMPISRAMQFFLKNFAKMGKTHQRARGLGPVVKNDTSVA
jgi:hypothetical protein